MKTRKSRKVKTIKAWGVFNEKRTRLVAIELGSGEPERFTIGTWQFFREKGGSDAVPVTITYQPPNVH